MTKHEDLSSEKVYNRIKQRSIILAGNGKLKIYGRLTCASGKRMKKENRVFFKTETEAVLAGFRPCGHCMRSLYRQWKKNG